MRYEMRTSFTLEPDNPMLAEEAGRADRVLRWLHEYLPTVADMGIGWPRGRWLGDRYNETAVTFHLLTDYADVFAATADRLRIAQALVNGPPEAISTGSLDVSFELLQLYDDEELGDWADFSKGVFTRPQKIAHPG
jgi:hypothetical protein